MGSLPPYGVFTQPALMMYEHCTGEYSQAYLKRALILFEHLVFIPSGLGDMGGPDQVISKRQWLSRLAARDEPEALDALEALVLLDRDLVDDVDGFRSSLVDSGPDDLWSGTQSDRFISFVDEFVDADEAIDDKLEMKKFFVANIDYDYRLFRLIARDFSECTALLSEIHEQAVLATYGTGTPNPETVVRTLGDLNTFDFAQLPWQDIFRLRQSGFADDFRNKIAEWSVSYAQADDHAAFQRSLKQLIEDAKFQLIGAVEPNVREAVLSGIGGNLPSPIGVNPIGLFGSAKDVAKQTRLKKTFGWLFFIQRCRKEASNNRMESDQ